MVKIGDMRYTRQKY